ncbi:methylenetetrahydrofolate reductase [Dethiosulfatarculus sandiegensis]|nr:methylenetetrahydrofolate reductase [Dethiosulfatarculus sandiegensis]
MSTLKPGEGYLMALADILRSKDFLVLAEMETPKGVNLSDFVENARHIKGRVDAVLIPDMAYAIMRLSAMAGAVVLKEQGLEAIVQFSCRDRNRLALQGDLLGAQVLGLGAVMAVEGRPIEMGDHLKAKPVHDLDVPGFMEAVAALNQGQDLGGKELNGTPRILAGVRLEPWVDKAQAKVRLAEAKQAVDKGAAFVITPPVFDPGDFASFMEEAKELGVPVFASVMLLKSVGMARYMNQNLPGVNISEDVIRRIRMASDRTGECVKIAGETVAELRKACQGVLLVTTGWENRMPEILSSAGM